MSEDKPFKNRDEVKQDIRLCFLMGQILIFVSLGLALLGVISDALNVTLVLETSSWFQLAIVVGLIALVPNMRSLTAKLLYGIESELKNE